MFNQKAKILNRKILPENEEFWQDMLNKYDNKTVDITIKQYRDTRTKVQNRLYWKYLHLIALETGSEKEQLHALFIDKFLQKEDFKLFGYAVKIPDTTTGLDKKEFSTYLNRIEELTQIPIPNPWLEEYQNI